MLAIALKAEPDIYVDLTCEAGSGASIRASAWTIDHTAPSSVRDHT